MIADERAGNTHQSTRDDASGRSGEVAGEPGWPSQPVEENAGDDARLREPEETSQPGRRMDQGAPHGANRQSSRLASFDNPAVGSS